MIRYILLTLALGTGVVIPFLAEPAKPVPIETLPPAAVELREHEPLKAIPTGLELDSRKIALGKALFHERRLSRNDTISCASCHDLARGGVDGRVVSIGIDGAQGSINSPTVFNSGLNFKQFWDGRASTLEEQIDGPIHSVDEMGSSWPEIEAKLSRSPEYVKMFREIYPEGVKSVAIKDALATFERSLVTPNSRFDKFLRGDDNALDADEREGYARFKSFGCASCHQGVNVGGNMVERMGAMADYFADRGKVTKADFGRFNVTGREEDRFVFKVPSLRNVALTAPYFHDGSAQSLEDAVRFMAKFQLGQALSDEDMRKLVKFLRTLTGEYEGRTL